jgi:opacity protein-like surface antigen
LLIFRGRVLKGHLLTTVAVLALTAAGPALAADLPFKAPPPAIVAWGWSGFYIGGHGGYGWGHDAQTDFNDPFFNGKVPGFAGLTGFDPKGGLGGIHAGYNWQSKAFVAGFEGDLSFTDIKGSSFNTGSATSAFNANTVSAANSGAFDMLGSARGRLGYLVTPNVMLYGTGGLAWTRFVNNNGLSTVSVNIPPPGVISLAGTISTPSWRFGWVAGLGVETRLLDTNWLARLEYLHYDFGNSGGGSNSQTLFSQTTGSLTADVIRAGITYKFDPDPFARGSGGSPNPSLVYKAAPPALPWSWSGVYFGAHAGYGWTRDPFNNLMVNSVPLFGIDSSGFVGGFQAGANWQSGPIVGGLEIDLSASDIKGSTANSTTANGVLDQSSQTDKLDWFGSARARLGYLVTPDILLYGTGGPGWARMVSDQESVRTLIGFPPPTTTSTVTPSWMFGWVVGAGVEARIANTNWLARLEYLHYDFGSGASGQSIPAGGGLTTTITSGHLTNDVVQAGVSYKFDGSGGAYRSAYNAMAAVPPAAAIFNWSGFYIGVNAGYGWGRDPFSELFSTSPLLTLSGVNSQGFLGGFQAGANWQSRSVVGGLEIDLSGTGIKGTSSVAGIDNFGAPLSQMQTDKFDLLGSGRARLGYLLSPDILLYGTGGLAWTRLTQTTTVVDSDGTFINSTPSWRFGWAAGAGAEMRLWNSNWLGRIEYLHYDFGNFGNTIGGISNGVIFLTTANTTSQHLTTDIVRGGVSYKFN